MDGSPLIDIGLPVALAIIMVGIGLTLTVADFRAEARQPRGMVVGSLGQLLVTPALGFVIAAALSLDPVVAVGLVIAAACPGGTTSNLIAFLGRANVALSIVMTVVASIVTIVTLPVFTDLALAWQPGVDGVVEVPVGRSILTLIGIILVPVAVGMVVRARNVALAARLERVVAVFGAGVLAALIVGIAISLGGDVLVFLRQAGPAVLLLNAGGIAVGWFSGRAAGLEWVDRLTLAIELGVKNSTLGILLATLLSNDFAYAVPSAVYGLLMYVSAAGLAIVGRRHHRVPQPVDRATPGPDHRRSGDTSG